MKKVTITNNQKQGKKWESAEVQIPESFKELAQYYHNGNMEQAGEALFKYALHIPRLAVSLRQSSKPQLLLDQICSGKLQTMSNNTDYIAERLENLLKSGKLDASQLAKLLACKTRKDKVSFLANLEAKEQAEAQAQAEAEVEEKPKPKPKPKK